MRLNQHHKPNYEVGYKACAYFNVVKDSDTFKPTTNCLTEKLGVDWWRFKQKPRIDWWRFSGQPIALITIPSPSVIPGLTKKWNFSKTQQDMQANRNLTKPLTQQCPAKRVAFSQIASSWVKRRPEQGEYSFRRSPGQEAQLPIFVVFEARPCYLAQTGLNPCPSASECWDDSHVLPSPVRQAHHLTGLTMCHLKIRKKASLNLHSPTQ